MNQEITLKDIIDPDIGFHKRTNRLSTINLLLKSSRKLSGFNIKSGVYEKNEYNEINFKEGTFLPFQFTGLISYLILLEQIGSAFKPKNVNNIDKTNGIYRSLKYYSNLDSDSITCILNLRNSLVHKFGLSTENKKDNFHYILSSERNRKIIKKPDTKWDGDYSNKQPETYVTIYQIDLIILIESIYSKILEDLHNDNLELILDKGMAELVSRYTIIC